MMTPTQRQKGFSIMEVLIAMIVVAIGLLGTAAMQTVSMESTVNSANRTVALYLANDLIDRIRANRAGHDAGNYNDVSTAALDADCLTATGCTVEEMAKHDMQEWLTGLDNNLPSGTGTIARNGDAYLITVSWLERVKKAATEADAKFETGTVTLTVRP